MSDKRDRQKVRLGSGVSPGLFFWYVNVSQPSISPSQSAPSGTDAKGADHGLLLLQVTDLPPQAAHGARVSVEASLGVGWGWIGLGKAMRPRVPRQGAVSANDATDGQMQCDQKRDRWPMLQKGCRLVWFGDF